MVRGRSSCFKNGSVCLHILLVVILSAGLAFAEKGKKQPIKNKTLKKKSSLEINYNCFDNILKECPAQDNSKAKKNIKAPDSMANVKTYKSVSEKSFMKDFNYALHKSKTAETPLSPAKYAYSNDVVKTYKRTRDNIAIPSDFENKENVELLSDNISGHNPLITGGSYPNQDEFDKSLYKIYLNKGVIEENELESVDLAFSIMTANTTATTRSSTRPNIFPGFSSDNDFDVIPLPEIPQDCPDLNGDGIVNIIDQSILTGNYYVTGDNVTGDLNQDGIVDPNDLAILSQYMMQDPGCGYYHGSELPYQTSFEPMQGYQISLITENYGDPNDPQSQIIFSSLDGVNGWQVESGIAGLVWHNYVYAVDDPNNIIEGKQNVVYIPDGTCSKSFKDDGSDNDFIQFEIYPGYNSEVYFSKEDDIVAGIKFNYTPPTDPSDPNSDDYTVCVWDGMVGDYVSTSLDYRIFHRLVLAAYDAPIRMQFFLNMRWEDDRYDIWVGADGAPGFLLDEFVPMTVNIPLGGDSLDKVTVSAEYNYNEYYDHNMGFLYFDRLYIGSYPMLDHDTLKLINCAFDMTSPCQCDTFENGLDKALTPVLGTFMGYSTSGYNICCCPVEQGKMEWFEDGNGDLLFESYAASKWYVSDIRHKLRPENEDDLGWFRTGQIPNGYYYLSVIIFSDITDFNDYAVPWDVLWMDYQQQTVSGQILEYQPASTITVAGKQKGHPYRTSYKTAISVPWAGDVTGLPFELVNYYSSANCLKAKPFYNGWNCNYEYSIVEDTRFNFEYEYNLYSKLPYADHGDWGLGFGFITVKTPDGGGMVFRRYDDSSTSDGTAEYYPYPDFGSNDKIIRHTGITTSGGSYYLNNVSYTLIRGDGSKYYFYDEAGDVELASGGGTVGWYCEAKIQKIEDRFGNAINVDWTTDPYGDRRIDSVYIGEGDYEKRIKFYDKSDYYEYQDGFIDRAELVIGGDYDNYKRQVKYDVNYDGVHNFFGYYYSSPYTPSLRYLTYYQISDTNTTMYISNLGELKAIDDETKNEKFIYHPDMAGYVIAKYKNCSTYDMDYEDIFYSEWGNVEGVYNPISVFYEFHSDLPLGYWLFVKAPAEIYSYEYYLPGEDDIFEGQEDDSADAWLKITQKHSKGYLELTELYAGHDEMNRDITVIDQTGKVRATKKADCEDNVSHTAYYKYEDQYNINKPTQIDEYFDGKHKVTKTEYNSRGNITSKEVYDADTPAVCKVEQYGWHSAYDFPVEQKSWQNKNDDSTLVLTNNIYGLSDGTISTDDNLNIYLVEQKVLLDCDSDPNTGEYASTYFTYNNNGQLETVQGPESSFKTIQYDNYGYPEREYSGSNVSDCKLIKRYVNDDIGQVTSKVDSEGRRENNTYDGHGRLCQQQIYEGISALLEDFDDPNCVYNDPNYVSEFLLSDSKFAYDNNNRLTCEDCPDYNNDGHTGIILYYYDPYGNLLNKSYKVWYGKYIKMLGFVYYIYARTEILTYDYYNKLEKRFCGAADFLFGDILQHYEESFTYDNYGRLSQQYRSVFNDGHTLFNTVQVTNREYDDSGNVVYEKQKTCMNNLTEQYYTAEFDIFGRMISKTIDPESDDPNDATCINETFTYEYDSCDNLIKTIDPSGIVNESSYNNSNQKTAELFAYEQNNPDSIIKTAYEYYKDKSLKRVTSFDTNGSSILKDVEYAYDNRGRLTNICQDVDGVDTAETHIYYNYHHDPNYPEYICAEFAEQPQYSIRIDDAEGKTTWRKYNKLGQLESVLYPSGLSEEMRYFSDGTIKKESHIESDGTISWIEYEYDDLGSMLKVRYPNGSTIEYDNDWAGRPVNCRKVVDSVSQGDYVLGYDTLDRIVSVTCPDGLTDKITRRFDGLVKEHYIGTDPGHDPNDMYHSCTFYDRSGRFDRSHFDIDGQQKAVFDVQYYDFGMPEALTYKTEAGVTFDDVGCFYDLDNNITGLAGEYYRVNIVPDGLGRLDSGSENIATVTGYDIANGLDFVYNRMGSLTSSSIGSWDGGYVYGLDGNITMRTESGVSEDFSYDFDGDGVDESNMLTDIAGNAVEWDLNGQLVSDGQFSYIYDYDGSMLTATSLADPNLVIRYEYDPFGNRVGRVKEYAGLAEDESRYLLDYASSVPKVLMELEKDANGDWQIVRKNYYYGDMLVMSTDGSDGDRWYYFHDKLGSVRAVVDGSGAVLNNYSYTPWGADIESQTTETVRNNVRYAGYQYDNDLKQYYLWARMYSPYLARFNGYDPVRGDYKLPLTLNPYLYCLNDPVNRWDPSGRFSLLGTVSTAYTYASMAMDIYDVATGVMDIARKISEGASVGNILLDVAMLASQFAPGGGLVESAAYARSSFVDLGNIRNKGKIGEELAGIAKPKTRIYFDGGSRYRVPDEISDTFLREVKNVKYQSFTRQLKDYMNYANNNGLDFVLSVSRETKLSGPLKKMVDSGKIVLEIFD